MSCPLEPVWIAYVDGELEPDDVRPNESHLVTCERCRALVLALRTEKELLADVLRERPLRDAARDASDAPARGLAVGMPVALLATAAVAAVVGVLLETRLPGASWLSPTRLLGAHEMFLDLVFALRDRAPGLLEFALSVAAMGSLAALATFVTTALTRRVGPPRALGVALLLCVPLAAVPSRAVLEIHEEGLVLASGETLEGSIVASGEIVRIDGTIDGNLVAFAEQLEVRGRVTGLLISMARETEITGTIDGTLVMVGEDLHLEGEARSTVLTAGDRIAIEEEARIASDLVAFGADVVMEGTVGRDFISLSEKVRLLGSVGRDAELFVERGAVESSAQVAGAVAWHTWNPDDVRVDAGATVGGGATTTVVEHDRPGYWSRYTSASFYFWILIRVAAAFGVGLLVYALFPRLFGGAIPDGRDFFVSMGKGFVVLLVTPAVIVLLALTLVGMPAALILAGVLLAAIYLAGILVAALIGLSITRPAGDTLRDFGVALITGLGVLAVGTLIPGLGVLLHVVVAMVGLGLLIDRARAVWQRSTAIA